MALGDAQRMKDRHRFINLTSLARVIPVAERIVEATPREMIVSDATGRSMAGWLLTLDGMRKQAAERMITAEEDYLTALEDATTQEERNAARHQFSATLGAIRNRYMY